jgi:hypothetical protein
MLTMARVWRVSGSYFEVCTCEAICPCRRHGSRKGGRAPMTPVTLRFPGILSEETQTPSMYQD